MHVLGGSASTTLAERVSRELGNAPFAIPFRKRFPDGELYLRVGGSFEGQDVVVVQSLRSDSDVIELFLLEDAVREAGARKVWAVIPYFGYSRQDRRFFPGEPVSARALARRVETDADAIITVDLHSPLNRGAFLKPLHEASGIPAIGRLLRERPVDLLVSPDKGGVDRVRRMAELLGKPWIALEKKRIDSERVELYFPPAAPEVKGKHVVIVDDVISTGGTIVESAKLLRARGAEAITATCTHGLFLKDAFERIKAVTDDVFATDTVENPVERASVAPDIAAILRRELAQEGVESEPAVHAATARS
ncbi:MAG: ribose-phosphate diphosphokinase [Euryarchaeota archaeon]|nr:ribose-phosphate diphosphokinase [Euryarchaeota archaeon]MDE1836150.1 ribose-phosphate diphosphokinase [Euryarchaeota archaeon]MDE1882185.1 ribose-phosphate diphosphokinase [Euryarchaeota archaeon]